MLPTTVRIFLAVKAADLRRSLDGLAALTKDILRKDPLSGHLFVLRNRRGDRIKVLFWSHGGLALFYKRMERGRFRFPSANADAASHEVEAAELAALIDGLDLSAAKRPSSRFVPHRSPGE
jgi:transposase